MEQLKPPGALNLEGNLSENWKEWVQGFELYMTASGIEEKSGKVQVATFLHVAGIEARRVYNTFTIPEGDKEKLDVLKTKFYEYCEPRKNLTYLRHLFFTRSQGVNKTIDSFVTDLKNKAKNCDFNELTDSLIRDRIVCGIRDEGTRVRLLRETDLPLTKAVDFCRAQEISSAQVSMLKNPQADEASVHTVHKQSGPRRKRYGNKKTKQPQHQPNNKQPQARQNKLLLVDCRNCGHEHVRNSVVCPAFGKECHTCGRMNHFANLCRSGNNSHNNARQKKLHTVGCDESYSEDLFLGTISSTGARDNEWFETLQFGDQFVKFKLDTGADANVIPKRVMD
ncbi:uncharacterized protein [Argopecten irradians]|uniref:uncharacterized protein n=1 Tax=Argopecten irradians TaxID=31199 RepID=UPI00371B7F10